MMNTSNVSPVHFGWLSSNMQKQLSKQPIVMVPNDMPLFKDLVKIAKEHSDRIANAVLIEFPEAAQNEAATMTDIKKRFADGVEEQIDTPGKAQRLISLLSSADWYVSDELVQPLIEKRRALTLDA